jgi:excisionase family DNA binding protein
MSSTSASTGRTPTAPGRKPTRSLPPDPEATDLEANDRVLVPLAVSPRKAARYLGVGHDAIYLLLNQGRLRSVKLGRRRLIPMSELERFLTDELA